MKGFDPCPNLSSTYDRPLRLRHVRHRPAERPRLPRLRPPPTRGSTSAPSTSRRSTPGDVNSTRSTASPDLPYCGQPTAHRGIRGWMCGSCYASSPDYHGPGLSGAEMDTRPTAEAATAADAKHDPHHRPIVYYIQFGDRIKIGTSASFRKRLEALPYDEVLGIELAASRSKAAVTRIQGRAITGEWFKASPRLVLHAPDAHGRRRPGRSTSAAGRWPREAGTEETGHNEQVRKRSLPLDLAGELIGRSRRRSGSGGTTDSRPRPSAASST